MYPRSNRRDATCVVSRQHLQLHKCNSQSSAHDREREAKAIESFPNQRKTDQLSATLVSARRSGSSAMGGFSEDGWIPSCLGPGPGRQQQGPMRDVGGSGDSICCVCCGRTPPRAPWLQDVRPDLGSTPR